MKSLAIVLTQLRFLSRPIHIGRYTCVMHVFDFAEKKDYLAMAERGFNRVFAGGGFVHWLLDNGLLDTVGLSSEPALVLYFDDEERFKHTGLWERSNLVKMGDWTSVRTWIV
jgi:hypothetical protein